MVVIVSVAMSVVVILVLATVIVIVPVLFVFLVATKMLFPARVSSPIGSLTPVRTIPSVSKPRVETAIYISVKAHGTAKPLACANENSSNEPFWSVIAERRTGKRRVIEVTIWTNRSDCNRGHRDRSSHSNTDAHLCGCLLCTHRNTRPVRVTAIYILNPFICSPILIDRLVNGSGELIAWASRWARWRAGFRFARRT